MIKAKLKTLPSGLRVVLAPMPDSPTVTVEIRVEAGSEYESEKEAGLSHFLEHMCFKGTEKRPTAQDIHRAFDGLGAISNAFTSTEVTGYFAKTEPKKLSEILEIVSDIYLHTVFREEDIEKERGVIIEEIKMYDDQPQSVVTDLFERMMHGDQAAGRPVVGFQKTVASFSAKDFYAYRKKHYVARATVLVIAGRFDEAAVMKLVRELFKNIPRGPKAKKPKTKIVRRGVEVATKVKDIDQMHLILGVRSFPFGNPHNNALSVLRGVLSAGMSSRLFHKLRDELGVCYYASAGNAASGDHGEFVVSAGVDPKRSDVALAAILEELRRLRTELVPLEELRKVKNMMISQMYMALESSDAVAEWFADREIFRRDLRTPAERERDIALVTAEEVRAAARAIFTERNLVLAVTGREPDRKKLTQTLRL